MENKPLPYLDINVLGEKHFLHYMTVPLNQQNAEDRIVKAESKPKIWRKRTYFYVEGKKNREK